MQGNMQQTILFIGSPPPRKFYQDGVRGQPKGSDRSHGTLPRIQDSQPRLLHHLKDLHHLLGNGSGCHQVIGCSRHPLRVSRVTFAARHQGVHMRGAGLPIRWTMTAMKLSRTVSKERHGASSVLCTRKAPGSGRPRATSLTPSRSLQRESLMVVPGRTLGIAR